MDIEKGGNFRLQQVFKPAVLKRMNQSIKMGLGFGHWDFREEG